VRAPKVRLYIRIRRADGSDAYADPVWNRNRSLRDGYALIKGLPEHHPEGSYYLRFAKDESGCGSRSVEIRN
jgi:integrase/recombinase XerD